MRYEVKPSAGAYRIVGPGYEPFGGNLFSKATADNLARELERAYRLGKLDAIDESHAVVSRGWVQ